MLTRPAAIRGTRTSAKTARCGRGADLSTSQRRVAVTTRPTHDAVVLQVHQRIVQCIPPIPDVSFPSPALLDEEPEGLSDRALDRPLPRRLLSCGKQVIVEVDQSLRHCATSSVYLYVSPRHPWREARSGLKMGLVVR